jgi:hypothetical protein
MRTFAKHTNVYKCIFYTEHVATKETSESLFPCVCEVISC